MRVVCALAQGFQAYGGIAQSTQDLLSAIVHLNPDTRIEAFTRTGELPSPYNRDGIHQHAPIGNRFLFSARVAQATLTQQFDFMYCGHLFLAPLVAKLAQVREIPFLLHLHGLELQGAPTRARQRALMAADRILCVSRDTSNLAAAYANCDTNNISIVPNRVSEKFKPATNRSVVRAKFGLASEPVLLTVSRLSASTRHKGHERVLAALPGIIKCHPDARYLIAGDGDDRCRLEELANAHGVARNVRFLGRVPDELLPDLYRAADLFVMPSTGDGFGIVFVEAMASGTLAMGLDIGGAADALCPGELGVACRPEDFEAELAAALKRALSMDSDARRLLSTSTHLRFGSDAYYARVKDVVASLLPQAASIV